MSAFVHLDIHTEYSLVDSVVRIDRLMRAVVAAGMPAVALRDQGNLFALVKFYKAALAAGLKPIIGVDLLLAGEEGAAPTRLALYCQNREGYLNLSSLVSRSWLEGQGQVRGLPLLQADWFEGNTAGLIALSGGHEGDIGRALLSGQDDVARDLAANWTGHFPDRFYLECSRTGRAGEADYLAAVLPLASELGLPLIASNAVRFLEPDEFEAHETRVCIHDGRTLDDPRREHRYTEQQYLRTGEEMAELFADLPEALDNTLELAKRCNLQLDLGRPQLPEFPVPEGETAASFLRSESEKGLDERLAIILADADADAEGADEKRQAYVERLNIELEVIINMDFPGYFLIVADFILWAKNNGVPVGPGRGSGAGSLVAYALKITDLDPLQYDLLFERFLNPERVSMPDFDVDFCMEGRDRVIEYTAQKYGRERVSQIITYGSMAARAVVRDVGRVMGNPYGLCDRVAKLVPFEIGMTLPRALTGLEKKDQAEALKSRSLADLIARSETELAIAYKTDDEVGPLLDMALSLEGLSRNAGKHAGGVVIAPTQLTDFCPLYAEAGSTAQVTQLDMKDVESMGLVKFDFLGLRTLTIIDWAMQEVNQLREKAGEGPLDIVDIPLDDVASYKLLKAQNTTAVFQLESRGMKDLIRRLQPDNFDDIIALVALFRPGPLESGMVDDYVERKHGRAETVYPHEKIEWILRPTYGVILYQEQVMQIAQELSGFSLGGADVLRRAMGKKNPEEMEKQRGGFVEGAVANGVDAELAGQIFDLIDKFAGYGFNKSHSAAYALLAYQTAWLKAHYPAGFMAAVMSADMDNTEKVVGLIEDSRAQGLEILPPEINSSEYKFRPIDERQLRYGLGAIKGVGEAAIEAVLAERDENGLFKDLHDLCHRCAGGKLNKRALETLVCAGALDNLGEHRAAILAELPEAIQAAQQHVAAEAAGQNDLFGLEAAPQPAAPSGNQPDVPVWKDAERLSREKDCLGLYLTGHPIEAWRTELAELTSGTLAELISRAEPAQSREQGNYRRQKGKLVRLAAWVTAVRVQQGKRAFLTLDDRTAQIEAALFGEAFFDNQHDLRKDRVVVIDGYLGYDDFLRGYSVRVEQLHELEAARERNLKGLVLNWQARPGVDSMTELLPVLLEPYRGGLCPVRVDYKNGNASASLRLGEEWRIKPKEALLETLREQLGEQNVQLVYRIS